MGPVHGYPPAAHARIIILEAVAWLLQDRMVQKGVRYRFRHGPQSVRRTTVPDLFLDPAKL